MFLGDLKKSLNEMRTDAQRRIGDYQKEVLAAEKEVVSAEKRLAKTKEALERSLDYRSKYVILPASSLEITRVGSFEVPHVEP
jgi:hypothetical protein